MSQPANSANLPDPPPRKASKMRGWPFYAFGILLFVGFAVFIFPIWGHHPPEAGYRSQCKNSLKQIGLALLNYHDNYGSYPPAYIADSDGRPMHSWRVLLLPYLNQAKLYEKYRFDEAWDGPHNSQLAETVLSVFNCPSEKHDPESPTRSYTSYVAVVGPETMWPGAQSVTNRDVPDGTSNTLFIVEVANSGIHWMEPRDLHVLQMAPEMNPLAGQGFSSQHKGGAHALTVDGAVRFLSNLSPDTLRALLTRNGKDDPGEF